MGRRKQLKEKDLLEAIKDSRGFKSTIAARLHVDWHTADKAIKEYPDAMEALNDERESVLDFTEGKAIERIKDGDGAMIRFMLATKGKKRGYTYEERLEGDEDDDNEPLSIICDGEEVDPQPVEADE